MWNTSYIEYWVIVAIQTAKKSRYTFFLHSYFIVDFFFSLRSLTYISVSLNTQHLVTAHQWAVIFQMYGFFFFSSAINIFNSICYWQFQCTHPYCNFIVLFNSVFNLSVSILFIFVCINRNFRFRKNRQKMKIKIRCSWCLMLFQIGCRIRVLYRLRNDMCNCVNV